MALFSAGMPSPIAMPRSRARIWLSKLDSMAKTETEQELWGMETRKAVDNFPVSGEPIPPSVAHWLGRIKAAAARVNAELGLLDGDKAQRIADAGDRVAAGRLGDLVEHERERGDRRAGRSRRTCERRREHGPVVERCLSFCGASRGARRDHERPPARITPAVGVAAGEGGGVRRRRQVRAHAPD